MGRQDICTKKVIINLQGGAAVSTQAPLRRQLAALTRLGRSRCISRKIVGLGNLLGLLLASPIGSKRLVRERARFSEIHHIGWAAGSGYGRLPRSRFCVLGLGTALAGTPGSDQYNTCILYILFESYMLSLSTEIWCGACIELRLIGSCGRLNWFGSGSGWPRNIYTDYGLSYCRFGAHVLGGFGQALIASDVLWFCLTGDVAD